MSDNKLLDTVRHFVPLMLAVGFFLSFIYEFTFFYFFGIDLGLLPVSISDLLRIPFFYVIPILILSIYFYCSFGRFIGKKNLKDVSTTSDTSSSKKQTITRFVLIVVFFSLNFYFFLENPTAINCSFSFFVSGLLLYDFAMYRYRNLLITAYGQTTQVCFSFLLAFSWIMASLAIYDASNIIINNEPTYQYILGDGVVKGTLLRSYDNAVVIYEEGTGKVVLIRYDNGSVSKLQVDSLAIKLIKNRML